MKHPSASVASGGPYFDDIAVGDMYRSPPFTVTDGTASLHRAIVGDNLALPSDARLAARVTGRDGSVVHPAVVWDLAIGQSSVAISASMSRSISSARVCSR